MKKLLILLTLLNASGAYAQLTRTYSVNPLAIVNFQVKLRAAKAHAFITFFDSAGNQILTYAAAPVSDSVYHNTGYYTEAPALARQLTLGVVRDSGAASIDSLQVSLNDGAALAYHAPQVDLDDYMRPFWKGNTVTNETILMLSQNGAPAHGRLLFQPDRILSVRSFDGRTTYHDYRVDGRDIISTTLPQRADTSFDQKHDFAWFNLQSQWVVVTYTHHDAFAGPIPAYKGNLLPRTLERLSAHRPLRIVAFGMSITRGFNVSGYDTVPPYMPTYVDLFARSLREAYKDRDVKLYNAGLPGSVVDWAAAYTEHYVNPLQPDLVLLDFGMNDFWRTSPADFGHYIDTIIAKVRRTNPSVEFILIANMRFDPAYLTNSDGHAGWYKSNLLGYATELRAREAPGVAVFDMTTLSGYIYDRKKPKDCVSNPLHPNDYLARWYAQGLAALLIH